MAKDKQRKKTSIDDDIAFIEAHNKAFREAFESARKDFDNHDDIYNATKRRMEAIKEIEALGSD